MAQIKIKCPQCGRNYALTAPNPSILVNKQFTCKRCGKTELFGRLFAAAGVSVSGPQTGSLSAPSLPADSLHTQIGGVPDSLKTQGPVTGDPLTQIGGIPQPGGLHTQIGGLGMAAGHGKTQVANKPLGILTVLDGGKSFRFGQGVFVLGRDSSDSKATIKIARDPYMSRQHAKLSAANVGGISTCLLTCISQSNPIYINGQKINSGTPAPLRNGDRILLGMTTVVLNIL